MANKIVAKYQIALRRLYTGNCPGKKILAAIGTSKEEFISYTEKYLLNGMTPNEFGKTWGFDHIVPTDLFNLNDPEEFKLCWNYNNIMQMLTNDNRKKGASVHFSLQKLNSLPPNEYIVKLRAICEREISNTWNKYLISTPQKGIPIYQIPLSGRGTTLPHTLTPRGKFLNNS